MRLLDNIFHISKFRVSVGIYDDVKFRPKMKEGVGKRLGVDVCSLRKSIKKI